MISPLKRLMRKILLTLLFIVIVPVSAIAQEEENKENGAFKRTTALCFNVQALTLRSYYGGIGGKKWLTDRIAVFSSLNYRNSDTDEERNANYPNHQPRRRYGGDNEFNEIGIVVGIEHHIRISKRYSPFIGFSIGAGKSKRTNDYNNTENFLTNRRTDKTDSYLSNGLLGVECWLSGSISLSGQYSFGFTYSDNKYESFHYNDVGIAAYDLSKYKNITFGINEVSMTLAFYF